MNIKSSDPEPKIIEEYDVVLASGLGRPIIIDPDAGDYMVDNGDRILFFIAERPSPIDPKAKTPAETIEFNKQHVAFVESRKRVVTPATIEQREFVNLTIKQLSKATH